MYKLEEKKKVWKKLHKNFLMHKNIETYNYALENKVKVKLYEMKYKYIFPLKHLKILVVNLY